MRPAKRWSQQLRQTVRNAKIDAFLKDIHEVCQKHSLSIAHEDHHGAFIIEAIDASNLEWLQHAHDGTEATK